MKKTTMLKKNYEFKYVLDRGKRYSGKYIDIYIKRNNSLEKNHMLILIGMGKSEDKLQCFCYGKYIQQTSLAR